MAQFDANINILVNAKKAFATIAKIEDRINKLNNPTTRRQESVVVREDKQKLKNSEKELTNEIRLSAAAQRRQTVEKALNRAGIENSKEATKRVQALQKAGDAGKGILSIQNAVNAGLEKELQIRREVNRTALGKEKGQRERSAFNNRINRLGRSNLTDSQLAQVNKLRDKFSTAVEKGELDQAKRLNAQLQQKLKLLERVYKVERPGTLSGGARSPVGGSANTPGSPKYIEAQAKALDKLAKAGGPSSPIGGNKATIGSPAYTKNLQNAGLALRQLAKGFDSTIRKADKVSSSKGATGPLALPDSKTLKAATRGIQRIETSADKTQSFAERRAQALKRSEERSKSILEANKASVKAGEANAAEAAKRAKSAKSTELSTRNTTKNVKAGTKATKAAGKGKSKGQGLLGFGQTATNLSAGAGFPLLFGGGPGSVLGGLGGALLGGFGGSIIGGALGQQLDALGAAAISTAKAFEKLGATASDLIPSLGRGRGDGFGGQSEFLIGQGRSSQVANILRDRFSEVYGDQALRDFEKLAQVNKEFEETWQEIGVELQLLMVGPLGEFLKALKAISNGLRGRGNEGVEDRQALNQRFTELQSKANAITSAGGQLSLSEKNQLEKARLASANASPDNQTPVGVQDDLKTAAQKKQIDLLKQEKDIQAAINTDKLAAVTQALTARRDDLAILNSAAGITKAVADLERTRAQLAAERAKSNKDSLTILELEKTQAEQAAELERQQIAQANARALAERQILQEGRALSIQEFQLTQQISNEKSKFNALSGTELKQYDEKILLIESEYKTAVDILTVQKAVALEGKNELEIRNKITENFKKQEELALRRAQTQSKEVFQAEVLRQDRLQAIADQKELNKLTAENAAIKAVDSNNPERTASFSGAGLGFFAESAIIEANVIRDSAAQLEAYNEQIGKLQKRIKSLSESNFGGINDGRLSIKQEELDRLTQTRDLYAQLQPQIDAAQIKQAQFNDALAAVTPGVNALVGGLQEVVAGTKSAEEAFADFLSTIADQLIQTAATLIAQYIAIGLAKAFAGLSGGGGGGGGLNFDTSAPSITGNTLGDFGGGTPFSGAFRADGGPVSANKPYIVGERGPELLIPKTSGTVLSNEDSRAALAKYKPFNGLSSEAGGDSSGTGLGKNETLNPVINISTGPTLQFEGESYVKQEDFKAGLARAAQEGAKQGQTLTLRKLMMSPTARSKIGI